MTGRKIILSRILISEYFTYGCFFFFVFELSFLDGTLNPRNQSKSEDKQVLFVIRLAGS